jgi:hypothetical protein
MNAYPLFAIGGVSHSRALPPGTGIVVVLVIIFLIAAAIVFRQR